MWLLFLTKVSFEMVLLTWPTSLGVEADSRSSPSVWGWIRHNVRSCWSRWEPHSKASWHEILSQRWTLCLCFRVCARLNAYVTCPIPPMHDTCRSVSMHGIHIVLWLKLWFFTLQHNWSVVMRWLLTWIDSCGKFWWDSTQVKYIFF